MHNEATIAARPTARRVRVWDLPVRLFHWTLVLLMAVLFVTAEIMDDAIDTHALAGQAVLALVLFRLLWGFLGSNYARFTQFVRTPASVLRYLRSLRTARPAFIAGHNPLGGWMVVTLLALLLIQAGVGLFTNDDILFEGPLFPWVSKEASDWLTGLHEDIFHVLLVLVVLHVAAVIGHKLFKGENLVPAMFTGAKELPPGEQAEELRGGNPLLAATLLAACGALVYWVTL